MKRRVNRIPEAECYKMPLVELTLEGIPITPEVLARPRIGVPPRPPIEDNGEKPARPKRKKKAD